MDGLAEFEREIAREKAKRDEIERTERKHRHRHHHDRQSDRDRGRDGGHDRQQHKSHSRHHDRHRDRNTDLDRHGEKSRKDETARHVRESSYDEQKSGNESGHRKKRPRHAGHDEDREGGSKCYAPPGSRNTPRNEQPLKRDSWMTAPSGVGIDYVQQRNKHDKTPPPSDPPRHAIAERELNSTALEHINRGKTIDDLREMARPAANYKFGDEGSQWRMTKLKGVYTVAEQSGRSVEEVAVERFGNLREFDEAREESSEMERRRIYGKEYAVKEKPTGDLHRERIARSGGSGAGRPHRNENNESDNDTSDGRSESASREVGERQKANWPIDQTSLNRLRALLMRAKLRKDPNLARLEEEYEQAAAAFALGSSDGAAERAVVLDASHSRMLTGTRAEVRSVNTKRGKERGLVEANDDMSIEDMIREERRTRGAAGGEGMRLAERISKDAKFDDSLEYLDENAEKLAKRTHKSESSLKDIAVHEYTKMNKILESCPLCHHEDRNPPQDLPLAPIVSLATRSFLTLSTEPELTEGGAVIVPVDHHTNLLECNDDEWEEIRNFMKSLTRLYHDQGRDVIFYENAAAPHRRMHAALVAVPIPYELGETAPAFFREAMLSADEEWSQHKKIIDTGKRAREGLGKSAFRKSVAKEMPYFHAWFSLDGGLGHVVEDGNLWPKGDLFAREILGGMLDVETSIVKRQGRWTRNDPRLEDFKKRWRRFDWTRILAEEEP